MSNKLVFRLVTIAVALSILLPTPAMAVRAPETSAAPMKIRAPENDTYQPLPFTQDWSNTSLISADDDWSGVPGIIGYRGDDLTTAIGADPQTILADGTNTPVDVNANRTDPGSFTSGGIAEFEIADPVVAFQGSGTADAPFVLFYINTTGFQDITVSYNLRDIDDGADTNQQVALHYRVGTTGDFTNVPAAYVSDASATGATLVTPVSVVLPPEVNNQPQVQIRIMTTNAPGSDEFIGIDDISITGTPLGTGYMTINKSAPASVLAGQTFTYTLIAANHIGQTAANVVITDALPLSVTVGAISDGGVHLGGNVVSWTVPSLANAASVTRTVIVTAPAAAATLVNSDYGVWASNWLTRTTGSAVNTTVIAPVSIGAARGMAGQTVRVSGRATMYTGGFYAGSNTKFYIQDDTGGISVFCYSTNGTLPVVTLGDLVTVTGQIGAYHNEVQIIPASNVNDVQVTDGDPSDVPAPLAKAISEVDNDNDALGWLVTIQGNVTRVQTYTYSYEMDLSDGLGHTALIYIDKNTGATVAGVTVGATYAITGIAEIYDTTYEVKPRLQADLVFVPDTTAPVVQSTVPISGATGVSLYDTIRATFSEPISPTTVTTSTFMLQGPGGAVPGVVSYDSQSYTAIFDPDAPLAEESRYTATLTTAIKDRSGNPLAADYVWYFTTGYSDTVAPQVVAVYPPDGAENIYIAANITATFDEAVLNVNTSTFLLNGPSGAVAGAVSYNAANRTATLDPTAYLAYGTRYTATLTTGITDLAGNPLAAPYTWVFTTSPWLGYTPIGIARAAGAGWSGSLRGNVTVPPGVYRSNAFVIQDDTGGMYIYVAGGGPSIPPMTLGDVVQVTGTLKLYNGLLEMDPTTAITRIGPGTVPAPMNTSTANVGNTQGWLIQVSGTATWSTQPPEPGANDWSFTLNDGSGSVQIFVDKDTRIDMRGYTSPMPMRVIGFSGHYGTTPQVMPRYQSDIIDMRPPEVSSTMPPNGAGDVSLYRPLRATFNKAILPSTVNTATFLLEDSSGAVAGAVSYDAPSRTATLTPLAPLAPTTRHTATLTTGITDLYGNPLAANYVWSFTTGEPDVTPPSIVAHYPLSDAVDVPLYATILITFSEDIQPATLPGNIYLTGPYGAVPATLSYNAATFVATLDPSSNLLPTSRYTVTVKAAVADWAGLTLGADNIWSFDTTVEPPMQAYHGDIHNHTSYSDGDGTPAQALATGQAAGFDFMAITDHSYAIDDAEWANTLAAVEAATQDGVFVALRGFEYTQGAEGHINVYNTTRHATRSYVSGCAYCDYTPNLEKGVTVQGFYPWLAVTGTQAIDAAGTVAQFNHPGWINFNDWTYHPEVEDVAELEEVGNGSGSSYVFSEEEYIRSLDYGWKVGATNNADTHQADWGTNTDHRTGVWMPNLTKTDLLEALRARRTFATEDKYYTLGFKANGAWMGSEIPNTGQITFEIWGSGLPTETTTLVQLITNQGKVVTQTMPGTSSFIWNLVLDIAPGVHYYYVKAVQADGDRIVSSPVWTQGQENIAITDLTVEPSIATIYNPSLLTARITNRGQTTQTVTVTLQAGAQVVGVIPLTVAPCAVGPCSDGYANVSWQPTITGPVTITASLTGAPAADNPDDNSRSLIAEVTDQKVPLVLIDAGHNNIGSMPRDARLFANDLTRHGYNVLFNLDAITASDLNTETVKLLIINAYGPNQLTADEISAIGNYVAAGGSLWLNGMSDYTGKVAWANTVADRMNDLIAALETATGETIPVRMNDDEVVDGNNNNGYPWGVWWHIFPSAFTTGIGVNVVQIQSWSDCSLVDRNHQALTASDMGSNGFMIAIGDQDSGSGLYGYPNRTSNVDADGQGDAYIYPAGVDVAGAAAYDLPGQAGRLFFYTDANDPYNIFSYTAGDGRQNELYNLQVVMWLLGEPLQKSTVAQARYDAELNNTPDNLDKLVWIEGEITSGFGEFFNVLYVQDETGGVTVHAPAGDISATQYVRGAIVRVVGTVGIYNGDTEIEFFEAEQVQIITPTSGLEPTPIPMSTYSASLEINEGWLVEVTGTVVARLGTNAIVIDDGSGPVRAFLDGYNGNFADVDVTRIVSVRGLVSEDGEGRRIRVRNHLAHPDLPDDVTLLGWVSPQVISVSPAAGALNVPLTTTLRATFNLAMVNVSPSTFLLAGPQGAVSGTVGFDEDTLTAVFTPTAALAYSTRYTATLKAGLQATNGLTLTDDYVWSFTTVAAPVPPQVISVSPAAGALDVPLTTTIRATFNLAMVNVSSSTFLLAGPQGAVSGTVGFDGDTLTAVFTPTAALAYNTRYTATLKAELRATNGLTLTDDYIWSFTTVAAPVPPERKIYLPVVMRNF